MNGILAYQIFDRKYVLIKGQNKEECVRKFKAYAKKTDDVFAAAYVKNMDVLGDVNSPQIFAAIATNHEDGQRLKPDLAVLVFAHTLDEADRLFEEYKPFTDERERLAQWEDENEEDGDKIRTMSASKFLFQVDRSDMGGDGVNGDYQQLSDNLANLVRHILEA